MDMKISTIIRYIRDAASISQEEFAGEIGVSRLAVTRWENDASIPNRIAQTKIYEFARDNGIEVFDHIVSDLPCHAEEDNRIVLYHGSRSGIDGDIMPVSRDCCDFGKGFYMGTRAEQPLTLIYSNEKAAMYTVELDLTGLNVLRVPVGMDWALLVAYSRGKMDLNAGSALYGRYERMLKGYDVVVGAIADDRMFYVLDMFFKGNITDRVLIESLSALNLGEQYVALTEKACRNIRILERRMITDLERPCIREVSERNREYGIKTADSICREYRREGRYFDEILRDGK